MKRLAWFSPLPISKNGESSTGAYWSRELLPLLRARFEIELFYDGFGAYEDFETAHFLSAAKRHQERPFDLLVYQFEDKRCADFVRMHLGLIPGIVIFHDLLLTTDGPEPILNSSWTETVARFSKDGQPWPDRRAEYKRERPLAVREIALAQSAVFSCPRLNSEYRREIAKRPHIGAGGSYYLPHPVNPGIAGVWGGPTRRVAICGGPQIEFRAHKVFQALSRIKGCEVLWLVSKEEAAPARDLAGEFPAVAAEIRIGRSPDAWIAAVAESDIAVHAHFSVYGQLGPYLNISQMAGLPCVALDFGGAEFVSDKLIFKIEPGEREVPELRAVIERLLGDRSVDWGAPGSSAALEESSTKKVAAELEEILLREEAPLKEVLSRWAALEASARSVSIADSAPAGDPLAEPLSAGERRIFEELGWRA